MINSHIERDGRRKVVEELSKRTIREKVLLWSRDVEAFAIEFFPHLLKEKIPGFHKEIYGELPKHEFLAIEAFRGAAKSTIGLLIYPIWFSIFRKTGDISLISKSEDFVRNEIMRRIKREFESNYHLREYIGDMTTEKWSETYFVLTNGIAFEASGIDGQLRGGRRGLIALDDLEDNESASSEEQRGKLRSKVQKELIPKLVKGGQIIYMGTPVHKLCFLHQIIETPDNGWVKHIYPCMDSEGTPSWDSLFPKSRLNTVKSMMGSNYFATEYMCNPIMDERMPIKESMIRYWSTPPDQYNIVLAVDPAYSEDETSDYKTCVAVACDSQSNRYLMTYIRTHDPLGEFQDSIINLWQTYKGVCTSVAIPDGGVEKGFFDSFLKRCAQRKVYPPNTPVKNIFRMGNEVSRTNKLKRITAALQPLFESGRYYINTNHLEAREEILTIGQSKHDDIVDAMTYAEMCIQPFAGGTGTFQDELTSDEVVTIGNYGFG